MKLDRFPRCLIILREMEHTLKYGKVNTTMNVILVNKYFGDFTGKFVMCFLNYGILVIGQ